MGAHACDNCHLLKKVDISNTKIEEIQEFTFVHCTSLSEVNLPPPLHTITGEALTHVSFFYPAFGVENKTPMSGFVARRDGRA